MADSMNYNNSSSGCDDNRLQQNSKQEGPQQQDCCGVFGSSPANGTEAREETLGCVDSCPSYLYKPRGFNVYTGHFKDAWPQFTGAGKLDYIGETAAECLRYPPEPELWEPVRRMRASVRPESRQQTVFHGQAYDPERVCARHMCHAKPTPFTGTVKDLVQPPLLTRFNQEQVNVTERVYEKYRKAPVGRTPDPRLKLPPYKVSALPSQLDFCQTTFGVKTARDCTVGELVNPEKTYREVERESGQGHDLYVFSHADYEVGEKARRGYEPPYNPCRTFGLKTIHDNTGCKAKALVKQIQISQLPNKSPLISGRKDNFDQRYHHRLAKTLDPIRDTMTVPTNHFFGYYPPPVPYGLAELLHYRPPERFLKGKDWRRAQLAKILCRLKIAHWHYFSTTQQAFNFYNTDRSGNITRDQLREGALRFNIPLTETFLEDLFNYCDVDCCGSIDLLKFSNFLTIRDAQHEGCDKRPEVYHGSQSEHWIRDGRPIRLTKQLDESPTAQKTSASLIGEDVWNFPAKSSCYRQYGLPSIRSDIPAPVFRRVSDRRNYGDEADAWALLNPSVLSTNGIYESDMLEPRCKSEIRDILTNIGVKFDNALDFDKLYEIAAKGSPHGQVSVESFRSVLDSVQAKLVQQHLGPVNYSQSVSDMTS